MYTMFENNTANRMLPVPISLPPITASGSAEEAARSRSNSPNSSLQNLTGVITNNHGVSNEVDQRNTPSFQSPVNNRNYHHTMLPSLHYTPIATPSSSFSQQRPISPSSSPPMAVRSPTSEIKLPSIRNLIHEEGSQVINDQIEKTQASNIPASGSTSSIPAVLQPQPSSVKKNRKRKKKQCPDCHLFFSNLATHKQTHLSVDLRPHICSKCNRGFARINDLIRHENSHLKDEGRFLYKCPYFHNTNAPDNASLRSCHLNGCFSRCDTYKNHLKLLHFSYPQGTKKKERNSVGGNCKLCGHHFATVEDWIRDHIDTKKCSGGYFE